MKRTLTKLNFILPIAFLAGAAVGTAHGQTLNWVNSGTGAWNTDGNWSPAQVPTATSWARITNGGIATITDGGTYTVSNLWVAARNFNNATGTVQITSGTLAVTGAGNANNRPQVGVGTNALGRIEVNGGTLDRANASFMYFGGAGGRGYLTVLSGNVFMDQVRIGSDNDAATRPGFGYLEVSGGLVIVTNQVAFGRDGDTAVVNITGGAVSNLAVNVLNGTAGDDLITLAAQQSGTSVVTVATSGTLFAGGGVRLCNGPAANPGTQDATLRINGGTVIAQRFFVGNLGAGSTNFSKIEMDGGNVMATLATNASGFIYGDIKVTVKAGGITIDSSGYDLPVYPGVLADSGSPGGGLTKNGDGTLRLLGTNTYTGATLVQGGGVVITTASSGGGAVTANNGTDLGIVVSYAGSSLPLSSLTLNSGAGTNGLSFSLGNFGNPVVPVIFATNLTVGANRTNKVSVTGAALSIGQIPLIRYSTGSGVSADKFEIISLPAGVSAQILVETNVVKLDVTAAPALRWNGDQSADWDIGITTNWLDFSTPTPTPAVYMDGFVVQFDDGAVSSSVNLVSEVSPAATVTVSNNTLNYVMSGSGYIAGAAALRKQGTANLTMGTANTYSGNTTISAGTFQLGASEVIPHGSGKGGVTVDSRLDLNGFSEGINGLSGSGVVDNSAAGPSTFTVGNANSAGSFSGYLTNSGGSTLALVKAGNQTLLLSGNNAHAGGTTVNNGVLQAANDSVLGTGTLTLNGGTLSSSSSAARSFANALSLAASSTLGNSVNNGQLTFTTLANLGTTGSVLTCNSEVVLAGGSTAGAWNKGGTATLKLQGSHNWSGLVEIRNGTLLLDAAALTNSSPLRTMCDQANGLARLVIGPGAICSLQAVDANLRAGAGGGNTSATNIVDIQGLVTMPNANASSGRLVAGQNGTIAFFNLLTNGLAIVRSVEKGGSGNYCEFNFNGGTLRATADNPVFMSGYSNAFVRAGGAVIDSASFNLGIAQDLLDGGGGGGLKKLGAGALFLNGNNTYTGSTVVSNGSLGGSGTIAGPVLVTSGGALTPGNSIGTLTVNNTVTLQGTCTMELDRNAFPNADLLIANSIVAGGTLNVVNIGDALQTDDTFDLFDGPISGSFAATNLPALSGGLAWDTGQLGVNGTIKVVGTPLPPPTNITYSVSGNQLVLTWPNGQGWKLQAQTNAVAIGLSTNWVEVMGATSPLTNVINPANGSVFYRLKYP